ncbi:GIY-YIG nuclease family protein [Streptomyces alfalfae]
MSDVVYVIGPDAGQTVKIGFSNRVPHRLRQIQAMSPLKLDILWSTPGDRNLEGILHERFRSHRSHGEWFTFPEALDPVRCVQNVVDVLQYARRPDGSYTSWADAPMCGPENRRYWLNRCIRKGFYRRPFTFSEVAAESGLSESFVDAYGAELIEAGSLIVSKDGKTLMTTWDPEERYDLLGPALPGGHASKELMGLAERTGAME